MYFVLKKFGILDIVRALSCVPAPGDLFGGHAELGAAVDAERRGTPGTWTPTDRPAMTQQIFFALHLYIEREIECRVTSYVLQPSWITQGRGGVNLN